VGALPIIIISGSFSLIAVLIEKADLVVPEASGGVPAGINITA
jgi:hypothetical protein